MNARLQNVSNAVTDSVKWRSAESYGSEEPSFFGLVNGTPARRRTAVLQGGVLAFFELMVNELFSRGSMILYMNRLQNPSSLRKIFK